MQWLGEARRELGLFGIQTARLLHRRRAHVHDFTGSRLPDTRETFVRNMDFVVT